METTLLFDQPEGEAELMIDEPLATLAVDFIAVPHAPGFKFVNVGLHLYNAVSLSRESVEAVFSQIEPLGIGIRELSAVVE